MKLLGCGLMAGAGIWSGFLAAGRVSEAVVRCGAWCRMLELTAFELERFRTPLPELFASLSERLDGMPAEVCRRVTSGLAAGTSCFRTVWLGAVRDLPAREREVLRPLGEVLGRFGAEEQAAAIEAAREQMNELRRERQIASSDRRKICFGVLSAGGILLAVLLA